MADEYKELLKFTTNPKYRIKVIERIHKDRDREYENRKKRLNDDISKLNKAERTEIQRIRDSRWQKVNNNFYINRTEGKIKINGHEALFSSIKGADINMIPGYRTITTEQATTKKKGSLGGAIVGGMVAGPVGAVIGGSTMGKSKTVGSAISSQIPTCTHLGINVNLDGFVEEIPIIKTSVDQSSITFSSAQKQANDIVTQLRQLSITAVPEKFLRPEEEPSVIAIQNQRESKRRELQNAVDDLPTYELPKMYRTKEQWDMSDEEYLAYLSQQDAVRGNQQAYSEEMNRQYKQKMKAEAKAARESKMTEFTESFKNGDVSGVVKGAGNIIVTVLLWGLSVFCLLMMIGCLFISKDIASGITFLIVGVAINPLIYKLVSDNLFSYPRPLNFLVFLIGFIIGIACLSSSTSSQPNAATKIWKEPTNSVQKQFFDVNYQIPENWGTKEEDEGNKVYFYPYENDNDGFVYLQYLADCDSSEKLVDDLKSTGSISVSEQNTITIAGINGIKLNALFTAENKDSYDCLDYVFSINNSTYLISFLDKGTLENEMSNYSQEFIRFINTNNTFVSTEAQEMYLPEEVVEEVKVPEYVRTIDKVKIRSEASTECDVLGLADIGEEFELIEETDGWSKIKFEDKEAYIKSDFVEKFTTTNESGVVSHSTENLDSFILSEGKEGKYAKEDDFDGYKEYRYYLPQGKYEAKALNENCELMIETISTHLENGYKTSDVIEHIKFSGISDIKNINIKEDECIILMINSEIEFTPIIENSSEDSSYYQKGEEIGNNMTEHLQNNDFSAIGQDLKDIKSAIGEIYSDSFSQ